MLFPETIQTKHFIFVNYTCISLEDSIKVWEARNNPEISKYMVNTDFIPLSTHLQFVERLKSMGDRVYYAVYMIDGGKMVGTQNLNPITQNGVGESGLFVLPTAQGKGLGKMMKSEFIQYIFENGYLNVVTEKVKKDNYRNQQLNLKLGFVKSGENEEYVFYEKRLG